MSIGYDDLILKKDQLDYVMDILGQCTENFVYVYDMDKDYYCISDNALESFELPANKFYNATDIIRNIIYPEDWESFAEDIDKIKKGEKNEHNLEYRWLDKDGHFVWINCAGRVINNLEGSIGGRVMIGRIAKIGNKNMADNITGLFAYSKMKADVKLIKQDNLMETGTVLRIGVDNFKTVNERYGRAFGDDVLKNIADCIREVCDGCKHYKMRGDAFLIMFAGKDETKAKEYYRALRNRIEADREAAGYRVVYTISGGIYSFDFADVDYENIVHCVTFALNHAKQQGKNRAYIFNRTDYAKYLEKINIQEIMRKSINNNFEGFILHYQPLVDMESQQVVGAEALLRYNSPETGFLSPVVIIPILEESGLIIPVGKWIIETALKQAFKWQQVIPNFKISINLSYVQIRNSDVVGDILNAIKEVGINPATVQFEFTESGLINIDGSMKRLMRIFKENGVKMALDDFGTGYSSLSYLQEINVDVIKLDRSFVASSTTNSNNFKLIKHICEMSHDMDMNICLEGIESSDELERLREVKPDLVQGYFYDKPIDTILFSDKYVSNTLKTT